MTLFCGFGFFVIAPPAGFNYGASMKNVLTTVTLTRRDPLRNGVLIGTAIGFGAGFFALAIANAKVTAPGPIWDRENVGYYTAGLDWRLTELRSNQRSFTRVDKCMEIRPFDPSDEEQVVALWRECGLVRSWNDPRKDIARKLRVQPRMFLVGVAEGNILATAMAGYEGHRGWINYVAVAPAYRRSGLGREIMEEAERLLRSAGCPKINLQVRRGNTAANAFYAHLGYTEDDVISFGKRLEKDDIA
jgi:ribosomal protein S18 acetylase RimI-like enzyme